MATTEELIQRKTDADKQACLDAIENAFSTLAEMHKDENYYTRQKNYFPSLYYVMQIIKEYYDTDDILDEFDTDDEFQNLTRRGSWELDSYVQDELDHKENQMEEQFQEEIDAIDTDVCHMLENMTPDEWWETVARVWGICSPMDPERMKQGIAKMIDKLNRSNYQTHWRRIAGAFFRKGKDYDSTEKDNTDDRQKEVV